MATDAKDAGGEGMSEFNHWKKEVENPTYCNACRDIVEAWKAEREDLLAHIEQLQGDLARLKHDQRATSIFLEAKE
jgi:hypothetical protein